MTKLRKWLVGLVIPPTHIVVPKVPTRNCLSSMAMRENHAFGMPVPSDEEILKMRKSTNIWEAMVANQDLTTAEKASKLVKMSQLYEEATGQGFYRLN